MADGVGMTGEAGGSGNSPAAWHEADQLCTSARFDFAHSDAGMAGIDTKLSAALEAVTPGKDETLSSSESYKRMVSCAIIADTAREVGAPENYVRSALDQAVGIFEAGKATSATPILDAGALSSIIKIAHETGQETAYVESIFGHIREQVMAGSATSPNFTWNFGNLVRSAGQYGLGSDYQLELLEEGRARAHDLEEIDQRIDHLSAVAGIAVNAAQKDPEYSKGVIEEAKDIITEEEAGDIHMQVRHLNALAAVARKTGQDENYVQLLLRESLGRGYHDFFEHGDVIAAYCLRSAIRTCVELDQVPTSEVVTRHAVSFIGKTVDATPRERHQLLNGLLWQTGLPDDYTAGGQIEKKQLSYVFTS